MGWHIQRSQDIPHHLFASAEALFEARLETPSACLLLDMHLPGTSGLEEQDALCRLALPWPIVFMTGFGTIPMTVQAMRAGAVEFLTKPFDEDQLLTLLQAVRARAVAEGRKWLQARQVEEKYQRLTQRERQVFSLVVGSTVLILVALAHQSIRINRLRAQVEDRSIPPSELTGYTISLSNFGMFAGRYATPVVVPPCVAIVAAGRARHQVTPVMGGFESHKVIPLSVTFDHRACTGGEAARFLRALLDDLQRAR